MKILVTGASGFLGKHLSSALLKQGHEVFTASRSSLDLKGNKHLPLDLAKIRPFSQYEDQLHSLDIIFHVASKVGMWGRKKDFYDINVLGTEEIIKLAQKLKVPNLIYTSSPSVVFGKDAIKGEGELDLPYPEKHLNHYAETKSEAEQIIRKLGRSGEVNTICLRPHLIFGSDDPHIIPRLRQKRKKNKLFQIGEANNLVDIIHVDNAVHAHLLAMKAIMKDPSLSGNAYFVGQEKPVNLWQFIDQVTKTNSHKKMKKVSLKNAMRIGRIIENIYRVLPLKGEPPMTEFIAMQLGLDHYFSQEKIRKELDYKPVKSLEQATSELRQSI